MYVPELYVRFPRNYSGWVHVAQDAVHLQVLVDDQWKKVRDLRDYMMALAIVIQ